MRTAQKEDQLEDEIVSLVTNLKYDGLPTKTQSRVKRLLTDQIALQIGISDLPWSQNINAYGHEQAGTGSSTVVADGSQVDAATAAFINASYGHGFEYDDCHPDSNAHPGSVVVSTSIAIGEAQGATIEEVLAAVVAGYEVYARIGKLVAPDLLMEGWHPHAVLGPFGAAAAAASLWDLEREQTAHALAIASSHASGTTEYTSTGGSIKRVHAGIGARSGIESARLAKHGVTGPRKFLTGKKGFFSTFVGDVDVDGTDIGNLSEFELDTSWIKPYCSCGMNHGYVDAIEAIDPDPNEIDSIVARVQPETDVIIGSENDNLYAPADIVDVQYSLPFQIALAVHGIGNGYQTHRQIVNGELLDDEALLDTASQVKLIVDKEIEKEDSALVADLTIEAGGSSEHRFVRHSKGRVQNPLTDEEFQAKIDDLTIPILGEQEAEQLATALDTFGLQDPVSDIMDHTYT